MLSRVLSVVALALLAAPLAARPFLCDEAEQARCVREADGRWWCAPGFVEVVPLGRGIDPNQPGATLIGVRREGLSSRELRVDLRGLDRDERRYVVEEHIRAAEGILHRRTQQETRRAGDLRRRLWVELDAIAVREFRSWVAGGCEPVGRFVHYEDDHGSEGPRGRVLPMAPRSRAFAERLFGRNEATPRRPRRGGIRTGRRDQGR